MQGVSHGNAGQTGAGRNGWFIGHFVGEDLLRQTEDVEVKWAIHKAGETNGAFVANRTATSLSLLIRGQFRLRFGSPDQHTEVLLAREGDYAIWGPGVGHDWVVEEDCVLLTVRWPSKSKDQQTITANSSFRAEPAPARLTTG